MKCKICRAGIRVCEVLPHMFAFHEEDALRLCTVDHEGIEAINF
jgi:hypothetical protein